MLAVLFTLIACIIGYLFLFLIVGGASSLIKSTVPYYIGALLAFLYLLISLLNKDENDIWKRPVEVKRTAQAVDVIFIILMLYMGFKSGKPIISNSMNGGKRR